MLKECLLSIYRVYVKSIKDTRIIKLILALADQQCYKISHQISYAYLMQFFRISIVYTMWSF